MRRGKIFELEARVANDQDYFHSLEICRDYDLNIRSSMIVPMGKVTTKVIDFCHDGDVVLDIGTATGLLALRIGGQNSKLDIIGVDDNENLLQVAEENAALAAICNSPGMVEFRYGEMEDLPFADHSVDVVYSYSAFHKWSNPIAVLKEINRVCKPDGSVYLYDIARDSDEGMISFILQYISSGQDDFLRELKSSYTVDEVAEILKQAGLEHWKVTAEDINLAVSKR
ncbi:class I SAM-dependent methyltransferase [Paenibacillus sp. NPDC057934]|uniref:class I SAM-dependent methyltransferase n=1 Tax=Paenibacillus sp. NPDC057934 TaxID=3346282 RepID=UPI0036DE0A60